MTQNTITATVSHAMKDHTTPHRDRLLSQHSSEMAGMDQGMRVLSYLIAGVLVYGGLGWLGDHYLGTAFLLPVGIVLGAAGGCYVVIRRYGQVPEETGPAAGNAPPRIGDSAADHTKEGAR